MWKALFCLAFFAGLRGGEYVGQSQATATQVNQVQFGPAPVQIMHYTVIRSKTTTHPYTIPLGCSHAKVCPLCSMVEYFNVRYRQSQFDANSSLFVFSNGSAVTKHHLNSVIKMLARALGLEPADYSAHSIRSGAATTAAQCGFSDWEIMRVGGWRSDAYKVYIRNLDSHVAGFFSQDGWPA